MLDQVAKNEDAEYTISACHSVFLSQVDLGLLRFVSAIGTQGAISKETRKRYFVKTYRVDISSNGEDWISLKDGNKPLVRLLIFTIIFVSIWSSLSVYSYLGVNHVEFSGTSD